MRKGVADSLPGAVENRAFRRARAFDFAEAGNADTAILDLQFFKPLNDDLAVLAPRFAHIGGPLLRGRPARIGRGGDGRDRAMQRKHRRDVGVAAAAAVGQVAGVGLKVHGVAGVLRRDDDVEVLLGHFCAHGFPAAVAFGEGEARIGVEFGHFKLSFNVRVVFHHEGHEGHEGFRRMIFRTSCSSCPSW